MMISPSAARMSHHVKNGLFGKIPGKNVLRTHRRTFKSSSTSSLLAAESEAVWKPRHLSSSSPALARRWKSTAAAFVDDYDSNPEDVILDPRSKGFSDAAEILASSNADMLVASYEEAWMINLGRGNDHAWLNGPRDDFWWTGVHPRECPGKLRPTLAL